MEGIGRFLSASIAALMEVLEAGMEEGVGIEVESLKQDETLAESVREEAENVATEESKAEMDELEPKVKEEGERKDRKEETRVVKNRKRDAQTAFWTTTGMRPLAEPPILDWDHFFRVHIPSDLRYTALFPGDLQKRAAYKDLGGEAYVLKEYSTHAWAMSDDSEICDERRAFYEILSYDLHEEWREVDKEVIELWATASRLSQFEYKFLDNDGKTTNLERWIEKGADIFFTGDPAIKRKYQHLVKPGFVEDPVGTFEFRYLNADGGTNIIKKDMENGIDLLLGWPQEVEAKYRHLRCFLPPQHGVDDSSKNSTHEDPSEYNSNRLLGQDSQQKLGAISNAPRFDTKEIRMRYEVPSHLTRARRPTGSAATHTATALRVKLSLRA